MNIPIDELLISYGLDPKSISVSILGKGHIHDTYLLENIKNESPPLILQGINTKVFRNVPLLMKNLELISAHIAYKNRKFGHNPAKRGIFLLEAEEGKSWIGSEESGYWRLFWYIQDQQTFDTAPNPEIAYEGGKAIGEFQAMLQDMNPEFIGDTIPNFHNLRLRYQQFEDSLSQSTEEKRAKAGELIDISKASYLKQVKILEECENYKIPMRLTHNDPKFNNILFDLQAKANCMIDLDTVMKGYTWFDFGDALRTCASSADEDEREIEKIVFRMDIFEGFTKGFLSEVIAFLSNDEIKLLHRAPAYFTFMQGLRFLTDYLNGNIYYKVKEGEDNYYRTVGQYHLMKCMSDNEEAMAGIIETIVKSKS
jgi:hypothetical protein